ncbi:MAG TPA: hypothetical protein VNZ05_10295, partial [Solirubrobacteraceae bacterium]|nr:hypothetical protein [Solirubrobacteraceae bacterium]
ACGNAKLFNTGGGAKTASAKTASAGIPSSTSLVMARTLAVLKGATPAQAQALYPGSTPSSAELAGSGGTPAGSAVARPVGGSSAGTTYYSPSPESTGTSGMLLNYLLGN